MIGLHRLVLFYQIFSKGRLCNWATLLLMKTYLKNLALTLLVLLSACASPIEGEPLLSQNGIEIYQPSIRLLSGDMPAAGYMLIRNTGTVDDRLLGAQADFADMLMLHKSSIDSNAVASMIMVPAIDVPAGQMVALKPGSFHIVFEGLKPGVAVGDKVTLTLHFEQAGMISLQVSLTDQQVYDDEP